MSNHAWVCFACRCCVRRPGSAAKVLCPSCAQACECLGYKTPIPPKSKPKKWEELRVAYYQSKWTRLHLEQRWKVRRAHDLEWEIVRLETMPINAGRAIAVKALKRRLGDG